MIKMSSDNKNEEVMFFVDYRNVMKSIKKYREMGFEIDFKEMTDVLAEGRKNKGAYFFDGCPLSKDDPAWEMHDSLRNSGFMVVTRICYGERTKTQKEIDVAMTCEIMEQAHKNGYGTAVIVSGDRDFRPALEAIREVGKKAEVAGFSVSMSRTLSKSCDRFHELDKVRMLYRTPAAKVSARRLPVCRSDHSAYDSRYRVECGYRMISV